jgi:Pentapeptide repeats (8 copies)
MEECKKWTQGSVRLLRRILQSFLNLFRSSDNMPVSANATTNLSTSSVTVSTSIMSDNLDNPLPQTPSSSIPSSIEELFSRIELDAQSSEQNSTRPESFPSCSLEELFGIDANAAPVATDVPNAAQSNKSSEPLLLEKLFEVQSHPQPVGSNESEPSGSELVNDLSNVRTTDMIPEDPNEATLGSPMSVSEGKEAIAPSDPHSDRNLNPPSLDLSLDEEADLNSHSPDPLEPDDTLLSRASQGDLDAFRQLLNDELAPHNTTIIDMESRQDLLQISLSGERVPVQRTIEPLIKSWVLNVGFVKVQKIELYGQREGSELPYWRSEFNPSELEYIIQPEELGFEFMDVPTEDFSFLKFDVVETLSEVNAEALDLNSQESTSNTLDNPSVVSNDSVETPLSLIDDSPMLSPVEFLPIDGVAEKPLFSTVFETSAVENAESIRKRQLVANFAAQYAAGERAFIKIDLSETDLSGINLTLADLQDALLIWANLQDASLYHVNLSGAKLRHANLKGAKLRSANLQGADFLNADLSDTDLSWSNLRGANLTGANLSEANLQNAILENVIMPDGTLLD